MTEFFTDMPLWMRSLGIVLIALVAHVAVMLIRFAAARTLRLSLAANIRKMRTILSLATSVLVFTIYFLGVGLILSQFGISLTAYLASASVLGLAVGFGSQGVVQDVVTGLTLIFADLLEVGELVNIGGQVGVVHTIGMRFVVMENAQGSRVSIPNRTITTVTAYPRGYLRLIMDVTLAGDEQRRAAMVEAVEKLLPAAVEQFPGVMRHPPSIEGVTELPSGRVFLRIKFRIWPERGGPIEKSFRPELLEALKRIDPDYVDWMITLHLEVERQTARVRRRPAAAPQTPRP